MVTVPVMIVPGPGLRTVEVDRTATLADVARLAAEQHGVDLAARSLVFLGRTVERDLWASTAVVGSDGRVGEVFFTAGAKGA